MRIGVDFGGVLTATTSPPAEEWLYTPVRPLARVTLEGWNEEGHVPFLISKAGNDEKEEKARAWVAHQRLEGLFAGMEYCRNKAGKIDICERLGIDVMVDDTERQLELLGGVVVHRVLFNTAEAPEGMVPARDWAAARRVVSELSCRSTVASRA